MAIPLANPIAVTAYHPAAQRLCLAVALGLLLGGCISQGGALQHQRLTNGEIRALPRRMVLIAPDLRVFELSGGHAVEEVPEWTVLANGHVRQAMLQLLPNLGIAAVPSPDLPADQQALLDEHVALYSAVSENAVDIRLDPSPAWDEKKRSFDDTLGPGLAFLPAISGADAALFIAGADFHSSPVRKVVMMLGLPPGVTYVTTSVVDLRTGDLLWMDYRVAALADMREADDVLELMTELFSNYPSNAVRTADELATEGLP